MRIQGKCFQKSVNM